MLLNQRFSIKEVLDVTFKNNIIILIICTLVYFTDVYVLTGLSIPAALPALMGTALAFFIAFNNNQAYDRWWEARIIWGALVNNSRSFSRGLLEYCSVKKETELNTDEIRMIQRRMIYRHLAFLYALKASLRKMDTEEYKKFISLEETMEVSRHTNIPDAILYLQAKDLQELETKHAIDGFRFLALNDLIRNFCDEMGKSERIKNTVFPVTYIYFTEIIIWTFVGLTTMSISEHMNAWSIVFGWLVGFIFYNTHINGLSLMNPFKLLPGGIPLDHITRSIEINFREALNEDYIPEPVTSVDGKYLL